MHLGAQTIGRRVHLPINTKRLRSYSPERKIRLRRNECRDSGRSACEFMSVSMCATVCINWRRRHLRERFSSQKPHTKAVLQLGNMCVYTVYVCVSGTWNFTRIQIDCFFLLTNTHSFTHSQIISVV